MFKDFPDIFFVLIYNLVTEHNLCDLILLNLLELIVWSILVNVLCILEKNVHSAAVGWSVL